MHCNPIHVVSATEKSQKTQQRFEKSRGRRKFVDLQRHSISYDGISFKSGIKAKGEKSMMIREGTFDQIIEITKIASLKTAFLLLVFKKVILTHQPRMYCTFKRLALELETDPCVLRRYAKSLKNETLIHFEKLDKNEMKEIDEYVFTMGAKFDRWLWQSKFFDKARADYNNQKGVGNSHIGVDNSASQKNQTDRSGLPVNTKQSATVCDNSETVRSGLSESIQAAEIVDDLMKKMALSSVSLSSVKKLSSASKPSETNVSKGGQKKNKGTSPEQIQWMRETQMKVSFEEWQANHFI